MLDLTTWQVGHDRRTHCALDLKYLEGSELMEVGSKEGGAANGLHQVF